MCGIVGYVGSKIDKHFLIKKLNKLEYRGYDSAGLCSLNNGVIKTYKALGKIANLEKKIDDNAKFECAILHTRWATNGKVNIKNCHPHLSKNEKWAIVHNGIIENCEELKLKLSNIPESSTDTAVVAEGLEENNVNTIFEFIDYFKYLHGGFAIVAINKYLSNTLFLAKKKNPLYLAKNANNDFLVASDPICFYGFSKEYYSLEDNEYAKIENQSVNFFNITKQEIDKKPLKMIDDFENSEKKGYSTYMLKEIFEEDYALQRQVEYYKKYNLLEKFNSEFINQFSEVKLIGCGTAYHACMVGAKYFQIIINIPASAEIASEFCYNQPNFISNKTLAIFVSQSGETADTLKAMEIAKNSGAFCLAFTNVIYSTLAKKADKVIPILAGVEIAVASTKAYICQVSALYMFVCNLSNNKNVKNNYFVKIKDISHKILQFDRINIEKIAIKIFNKSKFFFIGKDIDYITALESSLKINETTYINSNCYPSGELKHGYLALIDKNIPIFVFATQENLRQKTLNSAEEAHSRGAMRILITNDNSIKSEEIIFIDEKDELLLPILSITPIQYLACKISELKKINPDKPRHLAKSVTVE